MNTWQAILIAIISVITWLLVMGLIINISNYFKYKSEYYKKKVENKRNGT